MSGSRVGDGARPAVKPSRCDGTKADCDVIGDTRSSSDISFDVRASSVVSGDVRLWLQW